MGPVASGVARRLQLRGQSGIWRLMPTPHPIPFSPGFAWLLPGTIRSFVRLIAGAGKTESDTPAAEGVSNADWPYPASGGAGEALIHVSIHCIAKVIGPIVHEGAPYHIAEAIAMLDPEHCQKVPGPDHLDSDPLV